MAAEKFNCSSKRCVAEFLSGKRGHATITEPHTNSKQQTLFSMGLSHRKCTLLAKYPQPGPLPQRHSAGFAEAMRQAAASVAGELQIITSESEAAEDDDSGEGEEGKDEAGDQVMTVDSV
jgi:hypothetical protein